MKAELERKLEKLQQTLGKAQEMYSLLSNAHSNEFDKNEIEISSNTLAKLMAGYERQIADLKKQIKEL